MDQKDILFLEAAATVITLSVVALTYAVVRFLANLSRRMDALSRHLEQVQCGLDPVLTDLRAGAGHFRAAGERMHQGTDQMANLAAKIDGIAKSTQDRFSGYWRFWANAAGIIFGK